MTGVLPRSHLPSPQGPGQGSNRKRLPPGARGMGSLASALRPWVPLFPAAGGVREGPWGRAVKATGLAPLCASEAPGGYFLTPKLVRWLFPPLTAQTRSLPLFSWSVPPGVDPWGRAPSAPRWRGHGSALRGGGTGWRWRGRRGERAQRGESFAMSSSPRRGAFPPDRAPCEPPRAP